MKVFKTLSAICLCWLLNASLQAQGVYFEKNISWANAKEKAKQANKFIFLDAYTTWCRPCKKMDKEVFSTPEAGKLLNHKFISVKLDMEKGEGKQLRKLYQVNIFPSYLFFTPQGKLVHKVIGYQSIGKLKTQVQNAQDPAKQLYAMKLRFEQGNRKPAFLLDYLKALAAAGEAGTSVLEAYFSSQSDAQLVTKKSWKLISTSIHDITASPFHLLMKHRTKFEQLIGIQKVEKYIENTLNRSIQSTAFAPDRTSKKPVLEQSVQKLFKQDAPKHMARFEYFAQMTAKDKKKQEVARNFYFEKYCDNYYDLVQIADQYSKQYNDPKHLKTALNRLEQSFKDVRKVGNLTVKGQLLFKLKEYKKAKPILKEALAKCTKQNGGIPEMIHKMLAKIDQQLQK